MDLALKLKDEGGESFWIYTKDPSTPAFADLMNRTFGKPVEAVRVAAEKPIEIRWKDGPDIGRILARQKRAARDSRRRPRNSPYHARLDGASAWR